MTTAVADARSVLVVGAARPLGAEIVRRLQADGFAVLQNADEVDPDRSLDALVVNAPVQVQDIRFRDLSDDDFRGVLEDQLYEVVAAVQFAAARMQHGGAIVHIASKSHLGSWGGVHHAAAGAALVAMGRSMALELESRGIRVNTLAPDHLGGAWDDATARAQLAETVAWFAGPGSALISGETILVNRGKSLTMAQGMRR